MAYGQEVGRVSVRVTPDSKDFKADLKAQLEKIAHDLKVQIPTELNLEGVRADLDKLKAQTKAAKVEVPAELDPKHIKESSEALRAEVSDRPVKIPVELDKRSVRSMVASLSTVAAKAGGISVLSLAAGAAVPKMLALAGSLTQLAGVAAILPAAGAAGAAAIGALVLGLHGFGQALKDTGDAKKFAADLKNLAPPAQAAAVAIKNMMPQLTKLRKNVQGELFHGMAGEFASLSKTVLPVLQQRLGGVARALNTVGRRFIDAAKSSKSLNSLHTVLKNTQGAIAQLAPGVKPFVNALRDLGTTGSAYLPGISKALAGAAQNFGDFIAYAQQTGQIDKWIKTGGAALKDLADVALGAGQAIGGIISAAQKAGGGTLHMFAQGLNQAANVINGSAFQKGLTSFFSGFEQGFHSLMTGLKPVGSLIASLAPIAGKLATQLGPILGDALKALSGAAQSLLPAVKPLLGLITTLGGGMVKNLTPVLGALAGVVGGTLAAAFKALRPGIHAVLKAWQQLGKLYSGAIKSAAPMLAQMGQIIGKVLATAMESLAQVMPPVVKAFLGLMPAFKQLMPVVMGLVQQLLPLVPAAAKLAGKIALLIAAVAPYVIDALALALKAVSEVIPPLVKLVVNLAKWIGKLIDWCTKMATKGQKAFNDFTTSAKKALDRAYKAVVNWGRNTYQAIAKWLSNAVHAVSAKNQQIKDTISAGFHAALNVVEAMMAGIGHAVSSGWSAVKGFVSSGVAKVKGSIRGLATVSSQVAGYFGHMVSAVSSKIGDLIGYVRGIPGKVRDGLGNLSSLLYSAGTQVVQGFINGIVGSIGGAIHAAASLARSALDAAKGALGIHSPSTQFIKIGQWVGDGFKKGLLGSVAQVQSAARTLASKVVSASTSYLSKRATLDKRLRTLNERLANVQDPTAQSKKLTASQKAALRRAQESADRQRKIILQEIADTKHDMAELNKAYKISGGQAKLMDYISKGTGKLAVLAAKRAKVADQLKAAQQKLKDAISTRNDYAKQVKQSVLSFADITGLNSATSGDVTWGLKQQLKAIKQYTSNLAKLKKLGLSKTLYKELVDAGVDQGGATARALVKGGKDAVKSVNKTQKAINEQAKKLGKTASTTMYQGGVDAARGLVKGLQAKSKELAKAARKMADVIVKEIKKRLGIHSPSTVFMKIGENVTEGFTGGMLNKKDSVERVAKLLVKAAAPKLTSRYNPNPTGGYNGSGIAGGTQVIFKGNVGWDPDTVARKIGKKQRQQLALAGLGV